MIVNSAYIIEFWRLEIIIYRKFIYIRIKLPNNYKINHNKPWRNTNNYT